jgi:hypothetical protein
MIHANGLASDPSIRAAIDLVLEAQDLLQYKVNVRERRGGHTYVLTFSWLYRTLVPIPTF